MTMRKITVTTEDEMIATLLTCAPGLQAVHEPPDNLASQQCLRWDWFQLRKYRGLQWVCGGFQDDGLDAAVPAGPR